MGKEIDMFEWVLRNSLDPNFLFTVKDVRKGVDTSRATVYRFFDFCVNNNLLIVVKRVNHKGIFRLSPEINNYTSLQVFQMLQRYYAK